MSIFRVEQPQNYTRNDVASHPTILNPQPRCCENLKYDTVAFKWEKQIVFFSNVFRTARYPGPEICFTTLKPTSCFIARDFTSSDGPPSKGFSTLCSTNLQLSRTSTVRCATWCRSGTLGLIEWLICDWDRFLTVLMHLGLNWWALCAPYRFMGATPDGPQTYTLNVLWLQEEGAQIRMSQWSQSFTLTKNVGRGFILCSTPPTQWTVWQPH